MNKLNLNMYFTTKPNVHSMSAPPPRPPSLTTNDATSRVFLTILYIHVHVPELPPPFPFLSFEIPVGHGIRYQ